MITTAAVQPDELEHLVRMASCAPSVHNTQPWRFTSTVDGLLLLRDRTRQLTVLDPDGRELLLSCGAAVHHLHVAARALGLDTEVELFPVDRSSETVAQLRLRRGHAATEAEVDAAVAILRRHTHRGRFTDEPVSTEVVDLLRLAVEEQHAMLRIVREDELVEVEVLLSRAERALLDTPGYTEELDRWVWHGTPDSAVDSAIDSERGDGLPAAAVDHGPDRAESLQGRQYDGPVPRPVEPPDPEHPTVVLLSTIGDAPVDWVQGGRALSALLLTATRSGVLAQPLGQVIDVPASRWSLQHLLNSVGTPQMLLRLGHGTSLPVTPRRPVADLYDSAPSRP